MAYSTITDYLGWKHHCDEGIIMGLAPYGNYNNKIKNLNKTYINLFRDLIKIDKKDKLKYILNFDYFNFDKNHDTWITSKFIKIFEKKTLRF